MIICYKLSTEIARYDTDRKFRIVRDAAIIKFGEYTLRYITLIGKHYIVVDAIKDLTSEQAKEFGNSFSAVVSEPPEISAGTAIISNLDPLDITTDSRLGDDSKFPCLSEEILVLPDGRFYANGAPFRGGFTMERLRNGKWRTNTGTKDLMLLHTGFAKD